MSSYRIAETPVSAVPRFFVKRIALLAWTNYLAYPSVLIFTSVLASIEAYDVLDSAPFPSLLSRPSLVACLLQIDSRCKVAAIVESVSFVIQSPVAVNSQIQPLSFDELPVCDFALSQVTPKRLADTHPKYPHTSRILPASHVLLASIGSLDI